MMGCPIFTRATVPWGFLKAPLIPVWSLYFKLINNFEKYEKFNNFIKYTYQLQHNLTFC